MRPLRPSIHPDVRVVYVDNGLMVFSYATALMTKNATTQVVQVGLRNVEDVLNRAGGLLDLSHPTAIMFVACRSHCTDEFAYEAMRQGSADAKRQGATLRNAHGLAPA